MEEEGRGNKIKQIISVILGEKDKSTREEEKEERPNETLGAHREHSWEMLS